MAISKSLTTKEVARLCCVSDATVKRWDDAGLLKSERTSGGHRRFRAEEVARFQCEQELGLKQFHGDESVITVAARRRENKNHSDCGFYQALVAGSEEEASAILISTYLQTKSLPEIFDNLLAPAMKRIGELWVEGELTIAHEHLATRTALCCLHKLRSVIPVSQPTGKTGICLAIEGDFHELPAHLAQMILENEGWEVVNYGTNMPLFSLCEEISRHSPSLICIASTILADIERLARDYREFRDKLCRLNTPVILGGQGFRNPVVRRRFPAEFYAENFTQVAEFTQNLTPAKKP